MTPVFRTFCAALLGLLLPLTVHAKTIPHTAEELAKFNEWLTAFTAEARAKGISEDTLTAALTGLTPYEKAIKRDRAQPEFKRTFVQYSTKRLSQWRITKGKEKLAKHKDLLNRVAKHYGVQPRFILAFWGLETNYGNFTGNNPVIRSLATLAYDKRRAAYFRKELLLALQILDEGHIALKDMKGSWSGAMGQGQFMPSSFLRLAQDFDGDGKKDIWNNTADVLASIANYLSHYGWSDRQTWGRQITLPENAADWLPDVKQTVPEKGCRVLKKHTRKLPLARWNELGLRRLNGRDLPKVNLDASLILPDGIKGPAYLTYGNFRTILRYNCTNNYAITIGLLADKLKA